MKLDVSVQNLGQIREATFNIRPMTVITGPNGTGKSFFTKTLYSILNVINKNVYHESIKYSIRQIQLQLGAMASFVENTDTNNFYNLSKIMLDIIELQSEFNDASSWKINDYLAFAKSKKTAVEELQGLFKNFTAKLNNDNLKSGFEKTTTSTVPPYLNIGMTDAERSFKSYAEKIDEEFNKILNQVTKTEEHYAKFFSDGLKDELKDNFQISSLSEFISFNEEKTTFIVDELLNIELCNNENIYIILEPVFIDSIANLSSIVFFESPAYWKVRDALKSAKNNKNIPVVRQLHKNNDLLTGVPKYFYDLDDVLNTKTKTEGSFKAATEILEKALDGEFIFKNDNLTFKVKSGREISKNLISFGMTNLGMVQALLKHNVITEGSFIFFDEPETNLHPDWQVKLMEVLLVLAQEGVTVIIATHSSDLIKALEVKIKKQPIKVMEDFLSVHFVDVGGKLLEFDSEDKLQQLIEARELLSLAYQELYFSDL